MNNQTFEQLVEEAKKRGFRKGTTFKSARYRNNIYKIEREPSYYEIDGDLFLKDVPKEPFITYKDAWAEIIDQQFYTPFECNENKIAVRCNGKEEALKVGRAMLAIDVDMRNYGGVIEVFVKDNGRFAFQDIHNKEQENYFVKTYGAKKTIDFKNLIFEEMETIPTNWCVKVSSNSSDYPELVKWRKNRGSWTLRGYIHNTGLWNEKIKDNYTEITYEQFKQHIYNKMETKKIIGYKCPMDLIDGKYKAGSLFKKGTHSPEFYFTEGLAAGIPKEIVEQWEAVYEEEKIKIGEYEVRFDTKNGRGVYVNGKFYGQKMVENLYSTMCNFDIKAIMVGCQGQIKVERELVEKIVKRMIN